MRTSHKIIIRIGALVIALLLLLSAFAGLALSAAIPDLTVAIATVSSFGNGDVTLPVTLSNFGAAPVTVSRVDVLATESFTGDGLSGMTLPIAAGGNATLNLPVRYTGIGNALKLKICTNGGADSLTTTLAVEAAIPTVTSDSATLAPEVYLYAVTTRTVNAGQTAPFIFRLGNKTNIPAGNVRVKVEGDGDNAALFTFDTPSGWISTPLVGSEGITIQPDLTVYSSATEGSYLLHFTMSYTNNAGTVFEREATTTVYVKGVSNSEPRLSSVILNKTTIGSDNKAKATVKVVNPSAKAMNNISIALKAEGSTGFSLYENFGPVTIASLAAGGSADAVFSLYMDSSLTTGNHPIAFTLSWRDDTGRLSTVTCPLYVEIKRSGSGASPDGTLSKPRIIISKYSTDTSAIKAGKAFTLEFELTNTSADSAVSNLKVVLTSAASGTSGKAVFFPAEGSNSFYIASIPSKGSVKNKIKLMAGQDTEPGIYPIILSLEYEDSKKTAYTSEENISFSVNQEQRLEISGLSVPTDSPMGSLPVSFNYINKGKTTIYNLSVEVEGDFTLEGGSSYIGNVTAGYNDYFNGYLMPAAEGQQTGALLLKYENSQGEPQVMRIDLSINVTPSVIPDDGGTVSIPDDSNTGGSVNPLAIAGIIAAVLVIGGIVAFILIKRRKAAKGRAIDDED